jgi:hypothetical protein
MVTKRGMNSSARRYRRADLFNLQNGKCFWCARLLTLECKRSELRDAGRAYSAMDGRDTPPHEYGAVLRTVQPQKGRRSRAKVGV